MSILDFQTGIAERNRWQRHPGAMPWITILGVGLVVAALGLLYWTGVGNPWRDDTRAAAALQKQGTHAKFDLVDHTGKSVTEHDFRGRYMLVYFGLTSCPDICPTTLAAITNVLERLGENGQQIEPLFITVDPERDTPDVLAGYLKRFHPRIRGLTGNPGQVRAAQEAFRAQSARAASQSGGSYSMTHSSSVFFMGPDSEYLTEVSHRMTPVKIIERIRPFM
jgi:cytochrome oxidase Cu insertion factor (SCO1/SenC/PrrC family)